MRAARQRSVFWLGVLGICAAAILLTGLQSRRHLALAAAGPRADDLVNEDRLAEAEALLRRALQADPGSFDLRDRLADVLLSTGRRAEALQERRQALERNPYMPQAYHALADTCDALSRYSEAARIMERYLALWPDDPRALHVLAYCRERGGQPQRALGAWRRLLRVVPGHTSAQRGIARLSPLAPAGVAPDEETAPSPAPRRWPEPDLSDPERWM